MNDGVRILFAEDDASLRRVVEYELQRAGYDVTVADDGATAWALFSVDGADVVVTDLAMPGMDGSELLDKVKRASPDTEVVVITAFGTVDRAVAAMKAGAFDFITKPFEIDVLTLTIERAMERRALRGENLRLKTELSERFRPDNMIGSSSGMHLVFRMIDRLADSTANVLILGESGTGKELIARAIHHHGSRTGEPFVAVNCGALPHDLIESELFGVSRGAYTGADRERPGRFERAGTGTLFLDEITELPTELQVKLLRALQEREIERLGSDTTIPIAARFICATNADIASQVEDGSFRRDLYFRINVVTVAVPPLRERRVDIEPLFHAFLRRFGAPSSLQIDPQFVQALLNYGWPGNVRELENAVERALVLRGNPEHLVVADLPDEIAATLPEGQAAAAAPGPILPNEGIELSSWEESLIRQALRRANGNRSQAARLLGISRQTLLYRLGKFGLKDTRRAPKK